LVSVSEQLQIPNNTLQITLVRLDQLRNEPDVNADRLDHTAAAALALSAREDGLPIRDKEIATVWTETLDAPDAEITITTQQLEAVSDYFDIADVPPHPNALVQQFGEAVDMPEQLITVAHRLLQDAFSLDPTVVAGGPAPPAPAGGVLSLAALVNGLEDTYEQSSLGKVSGTSEVTVQNRCRDLQGLLEDRLQSDRYRVVPASDAPDEPTEESQSSDTGDTESSRETATARGSRSATASGQQSSDQQTAADGAGSTDGAAESTTADEVPADSDEATAAVLETVQSIYPDELPTTDNVAEAHDASESAAEDALAALAADGQVQRKRAGSVDVWIPADGDDVGDALTVDAVETEIDALVEELDVGSSTRLLARGMVSDAVDDADVAEAAELAATTVVAASRMSDGDIDTVEVARTRSFEPRVIFQWLDRLDEAVDADIPRRDPEDVVEDVVAELGLSEAILAESHQSLERYDGDEEFTAAELGAGAVLFGATIGQTQVDIDRLAALSGAEESYITAAMHSIVVSLCLALVRGDIEYDDCSWTTELLQSELSPTIGDSHTGRAIAIAKAYTAGREGHYVDETTLDVLLSD
jgi:transcription initiation factor TFIIIB Brf1 subunit/transcription initiation factor TFIIB